MLATINGKVSEAVSGGVIIEVAGLGYQVSVPTTDLAALEVGKLTRLYLHHHLREDSDDLYGFLTLPSKYLFEQLLGVSGVGPKVALAVMSAASTEQLQSAIANGNNDILQGVAGVGKKMAARIVMELRTKVGLDAGDLSGDPSSATFAALKQLGFSSEQAHSALSRISSGIKDEEQRLRLALQALAKS